MTRKFKTPDYEAMLHSSVSLADALPEGHLARFVVEVIAQLDLGSIYRRYAPVGGEAIAPEILLGLLFYGYATGVFSSRKIERATHESLPFRFIASGLHPDHDTIATFRKTLLAEIQELFMQLLLLAQAVGVLQLGNISLDGSKIHADASKSKAVSYKRLGELETQLRQEVRQLLTLGEQVDRGEQVLPEGLVVQEELQRREEKARRHRRKPGGRAPKPPEPGPREKDQYNFTDAESRIMKNSANRGFDQPYNAQVAVDQASQLIVAAALSNHPNDTAEAEPTLAALPPELGTPPGAALDNGYWSEPNRLALERRGIEGYIATGREPHHQSWEAYFADHATPPADDASPIEKMAYKLKTEIGQAIYRLRKCTVEPVIGIIKEVLGFRQFSLRGLGAAAGEWVLVCLAFNLKRLHVLMAEGV